MRAPGPGRWRAGAPLAGLLLLAGCAGGGRPCQAVLSNASGQPVEQVYLTRAGGTDWGPDLLAQGPLAPGATLPLRFPGASLYGLRAVWPNGRAVEMQGFEACRMTRVTLQDGALQAE